MNRNHCCSVQLQSVHGGDLVLSPASGGTAGRAPASAVAGGHEAVSGAAAASAATTVAPAPTAPAAAADVQGFVVPRLDPSPCIIAPHGLAEVFLRCGALQMVPGKYRLRAIALAQPIPADIARQEAAEAAAARAAPAVAAPSPANKMTQERNYSSQCLPPLQPPQAALRTLAIPVESSGAPISTGTQQQKQQHLQQQQQKQRVQRSVGANKCSTAKGRSPYLPSLQGKQQNSFLTGVGGHAAAAAAVADAAATAAPASAAAAACAVPGPNASVAAPAQCTAAPLIIDFSICTRPPTLCVALGGELSTAAATPAAAAADSGAASAAAFAAAEEETAETGDLGTLWFAAGESAGDNCDSKPTAESASAAAFPVCKELLLQPARHCASVRCAVSVTGKAFKLIKAELLQQQQQQHQQKQQPQRQQLELPITEQLVGRAVAEGHMYRIPALGPRFSAATR